MWSGIKQFGREFASGETPTAVTDLKGKAKSAYQQSRRETLEGIFPEQSRTLPDYLTKGGTGTSEHRAYATKPGQPFNPEQQQKGTAGGQQVTRQSPYGRRLGTFQGPGMDSPRDVFEHESLARRGRYDLDVQGDMGLNRSQMAELFGRPDMDPRRTELTRDQMRQRMQYDREVEQAQRSREKSPFDRLPTLSPDATTAERARFRQQLQAATAESEHQRGMRGQDIQQWDAATGHALTGQKLEEQMRQFGLQHGLDQRKLDKNLKMFRETMEKDDWWKGTDFLTQMTQGGFGMEQAADIAADAFKDAFESAAMSDDPGAMQKVTEDFLDVTKDLSQKISPEGHASAWETILRDVMGEHYGIDLTQTERTREEAEVDPDRYMR